MIGHLSISYIMTDCPVRVVYTMTPPTRSPPLPPPVIGS